ncbi:uncharacterized protein [Dysidea avara]|uniref:uncharacterized protein isoform X2 n=1 Tax=Dysidea avara TaxID=196820 RepID=UPI003321744C
MKSWVRIFLLISSAIYASAAAAGIIVRETTRYSAEIELSRIRNPYYIVYTKCNCTLTYETPYKTSTTDKSQVREEYPHGLSRVWISNLMPNCNYSCVVVQKDESGTRHLSHTTFTTKYDLPLAPPAPELVTRTSGDQIIVTISLFASSTKPGPVSGYELQFFLVEKDMDGMIVFLHNTPVGQLPNLDNARGSQTPADFRYHTYDAASLPNTVIVQPVVVAAFKSNCSYCAVLMAYRNATDEYDILYASSEPSTAFMIVYDSDETGFNFRAQYARNVAGIVLGGVVPVLLCLCAIGLLTIWCKYRKKKGLRHSKYHKSKQFKYPAFDATSSKSFFTAKPPPTSPQYDRSNSKLLHKPRDDETTNLLGKGKEALRRTTGNAVRRTSDVVVSAINTFKRSLTKTPKLVKKQPNTYQQMTTS